MLKYTVILLLVIGVKTIDNQEYKICTLEGFKSVCQQLERSQQLACIENVQTIDCILHINKSTADIGRISGEQAAIAANFPLDDVIVVGEYQRNHLPLQTVVLAKTNIESFSELKSKKFCHPGYKHDESVPYLFLDEILWKILDLDNETYCNAQINLQEKIFKRLSELLGDSCIPGPWTQNIDLDSVYKKKYPSLCKLCPNQSCDVDYINPFNDSLTCFFNNDADFVVTTSSIIEEFLKRTAINGYKFLCKNGTSTDLKNPCTWSNQTNNLLVAKRSTILDLRPIIEEKLKSDNSDVVGSGLRLILQRRGENITFLEENQYVTLKDYVKTRREIPDIKESRKCNTSIKFCTKSNEEQKKCQFFSQAVLNRGIQPVLECVQVNGSSDVSCINALRKDIADIFVLSSDYGYLAQKHELAPIAYFDVSSEGLSEVLIVVKSNQTSIGKLEDLKGKKSCFPLYGGKEWFTFIDALRVSGLVETTDDYENIINNFVDDSCMPDALSTDYQQYDNLKLCNLCISTSAVASTAVYCNADSLNNYYGNEGALRCLTNSPNADFAVITRSNISLKTDDFRVLCRNGTLASFTGLNVDDKCALNILPSSFVVSREDSKKNADIIDFIYEVDRWFGQDLHKAFNVYDKFDDTLDLLYYDYTLGQTLSSVKDYNDNVLKLLQNVRSTTPQSPSGAISFSVPAVLLLLFANTIYFVI